MSRRPDLHTRLDYARALVHGRAELRPTLGLVLGSGLGALAERLREPVASRTRRSPSFRR